MTSDYFYYVDCTDYNEDCHNNVSEELDNGTADKDLAALNYEKFLLFLPIIVYLAVCMVCGIIGNGLVCYVYRCRFRRTTSNFFIVFLAILDLLGCFIGMPFEISDVALPYMFRLPIACRFLRFLETWAIGSSGLTLVCVAFDRYYKLCKPLHRFSLKKAKMFSFVAIVFAFFMAAPALALFGSKTVILEEAGVNGTECSIDDSMKDSAWRIVYYACLMITFVFVLACVTTLYIIIACHLWHRKNKAIGEEVSTRCKDYPKKHRFVHSDSTSSSSSMSRHGDETHKISSSGSLKKSTSNEDARKHSHQGWKQSQQHQCLTPKRTESERLQSQRVMGRLSIKTTRITAIFFSISVAFVLSFLPFLVVNILKVTRVAFNPFTSDSLEVFYNFCVRSYFINNVINPFIYSIMNVNFRRECKYVFKKICKTCIKD